MGNIAATCSTEQPDGVGPDSRSSKTVSSPMPVECARPPYVQRQHDDKTAARYDVVHKLQQLKLSDLQKRAVSVGLDAQIIGTALDSDNPKGALVDVLAQHHREFGAVADVTADVGDVSPHGKTTDGVMHKLQQLKLSDLQKRAVSVGLDAQFIEAALDSDNPKGALVDVLAQHHREFGAVADVLSALQAGGNGASAVLCACLEQGIEALDTLSVSLPRRERKPVVHLLEQAEVDLECVSSVEWCERLPQCSKTEIERLASAVASVAVLEHVAADDTSGGALVKSRVSELLECVARCGDAVLRALAVLSSADGGSELDEEACVFALETLRGLSVEHQQTASADEVSAAVLILPHMVEGRPLRVLVSATMAMFTLGCRHGRSVLNADGTVWHRCCRVIVQGLSFAVSDIAAGRLDCDSQELAAASGALMLLCLEVVYKVAPSERSKMQLELFSSLADRLGLAKVLSEGAMLHTISQMMQNQMLLQGSFGLRTGYVQFVNDFLYSHPGLAIRLQAMGTFDAIWGIFPGRKPPEWWATTASTVNMSSLRTIVAVGSLYRTVTFLPGDVFSTSQWWNSFMKELVHIVKVNQSIGLTSSDAVPGCKIPISQAFATLADAADRVESITPPLLQPSFIDAVQYACTSELEVFGRSIASQAAGLLVSLVGRNERGIVLSQETVVMMLTEVNRMLSFEGRAQIRPLESVLPTIKQMSTMTISDTNKALMLECEGAVETILTGLLLASPRRSEDGGDAVQEACAALLLSLALHKPWADVLRAHDGAMRSLRELIQRSDLSTPASRRSAESALFELEGQRSVGGVERPCAAHGDAVVRAKQLMLSYCWDQQAVVRRVHEGLVRRDYDVWIDYEQMTGSTVESMARAVENAEVMLIGVSRQYKESTNCRLEAQYAMQREVPTIPLMLVDGYRADGWLGMLIGTRMWYGFFGEVLTAQSLFDAKIFELCRDLGERGQRRTEVALKKATAERALTADIGDVSPHGNTTDDVVHKLQQLKLSDLQKRAVSVGLDAQIIGTALDSDNPKGALVDVLAQHHREFGAVADVTADVGDVSPHGNTTDGVMHKLQQLKLSDLQKRAVSVGLDAQIIEAALDSDNPKGALVDVLAQHHREFGVVADVLSVLQAGGNGASAVLCACLEQGIEALDTLSVSLPRRERKPVVHLLEQAEVDLECVSSVEWCERLPQCSKTEIERLASAVASVAVLEHVAADDTSRGALVKSRVSELLECVARCGDAVLRALAVLSSADGGSELDEEACVFALETLRGLSVEHQQTASADEVSAAILILPHMVEGRPLRVLVSATMAMFTLGCRHGRSVLNADGVWSHICQHVAGSSGMAPIVAEAPLGNIGRDALHYISCTAAMYGLCVECVGKCPSSERSHLDNSLTKVWAERLVGADKIQGDEGTMRIVACLLQSGLLEAFDPSIACGAAFCVGNVFYTKPHLAQALGSMHAFDAVWDFAYFRVRPSVQPADWWTSTAGVVDAHSALLPLPSFSLLLAVRGMPVDMLVCSSWLPKLVPELIHVVKMNHAAGLTARDTAMGMFLSITNRIIANSASVQETVNPLMLQPEFLDGLEYASINDFRICGLSTAADAAGALVALVGRNEGGKTLSLSTIKFMVDDFKANVTFVGYRKNKPLASMLGTVQRLVTMAISDTNKALMLECEGAIETILTGLLLASPRRSEDGGDAVQEACAALLLSLALHKPWADVLRAHDGAMRSLRELIQRSDLSTPASRRSAESALFELEGQRSVGGVERPCAAHGDAVVRAKQLMLSYCWDQQAVVRRVHEGLVRRDYNVWIDYEQMTGSTVESMARAVENAEVMLIGVSRQYKESTNCRLEAQYAMQREVPTIPLMLVDGYRADGWLGMLIGTRMWYGFFGEVLTAQSLFDAKISELCRDLGERGRRDVVLATVSAKPA